MSVKLTLTLDENVIGTAKKHASKTGKSLSRIVENYLRSISAENTVDESISPEILKFMGVIKLPRKFDYKKQMGNTLSKKYKK